MHVHLLVKVQYERKQQEILRSAYEIYKDTEKHCCNGLDLSDKTGVLKIMVITRFTITWIWIKSEQNI